MVEISVGLLDHIIRVGCNGKLQLEPLNDCSPALRGVSAIRVTSDTALTELFREYSGRGTGTKFARFGLSLNVMEGTPGIKIVKELEAVGAIKNRTILVCRVKPSLNEFRKGTKELIGGCHI